MKIKLFIGFTLALCLVLTGCKVGNVASHQGLPDRAYLYFVSTQAYHEPVSVAIGSDLAFEAKVVKEKKSTVKGNTYAVSTGKRHIVVTYKDQKIYEKDIFLSAQETKKIILP